MLPAWIKLKKFCEITGESADRVLARRNNRGWERGIHYEMGSTRSSMWINTQAVADLLYPAPPAPRYRPWLKRLLCLKRQTPVWANKDEIDLIYAKAKSMSSTGIKYHVDHYFPLQGKFVSGLHVAANLQVIPATENMKKHNKYTP